MDRLSLSDHSGTLDVTVGKPADPLSDRQLFLDHLQAEVCRFVAG